MLPNSEIKLQSFYIFNSMFCLKEGEEDKKILFYHPFSTDVDSKIRSIGLVEAVIKFTETFNPDEPCSSLHTQKTRQIFHQAEKNYWMAMTVNVPIVNRTKDDTSYNEYHGEEIQDTVYRSVLKQSYLMFRLFSGTFQSIVDKSGVAVLRQTLEHFFPRYLLTLKLNTCDILNVFNGMQYLPLNNLTFLNVLCFVNKLQNDFKSIKYTAFMYNEHLVWTSFEPNKFQPVYQYMIGTLLPAQLETELQGGSMPRHHMFSGSSSQSQRYCRFVTGPTTLSEGASYMGKVPKIHLNLTANPDETEEFFLVVYRGFSSSVLMFMDVSTDLNMELYQKLDEFMEPALTALGSEIAEYCSTQPLSSHVATNVSESGSRFVYFNKLNLAYKSTVHLDNRQLGNINVSHEALKLIADLNADQMSQRFYGEIIAKTMSNYWVVGKFSNQREFYVAINNNKNLIEINDEVKKLCDAELKGIFFQT